LGGRKTEVLRSDISRKTAWDADAKAEAKKANKQASQASDDMKEASY